MRIERILAVFLNRSRVGVYVAQLDLFLPAELSILPVSIRLRCVRVGRWFGEVGSNT